MPIRHCPAGSEPYPGAIEVAYFEAADVLVIADLIGSPLLDILLFPWIDAAFDVATLCNSDPPDPPVFYASDFLNPAVLSGKAQVLIQSYMWDFWCRCIGYDANGSAGWNEPNVIFGQWQPVDVVPGSWSYIHLAHFGDYGILRPQTTGMVINFGGPFYVWKGTADTIPFPNDGKPLTTGSVIGPFTDQIGIYRHDGYPNGWPPGMPAQLGLTWVMSGSTFKLQVETNEAVGILDLKPYAPGPPAPPSIPPTVQFPADIAPSLADIQQKLRALESKLDRLIPMADLRLPRIVDGWLQELVASDVVGVDVYTVAADGFLVDLTTIPATAGNRPGPVPLYEVNARALQLGWVAWTETSDEPGWKWQRIDMAKTWIAAAEGTVQSVEVSLAPGVVADLYKLIRHYA